MILGQTNNIIQKLTGLSIDWADAVLFGFYRNLPRHQFGNLQSKMFPAYFTLISACAAISVAAFAYLHPWKTASAVERYQLGFLLSALGCDLSNLLVFTPMTIEVSNPPNLS